MSDLYLIAGSPRTEYVTREVREFRAPTDASAKLLDELTQAAEDRINKMVRVKNMNIDCVVHIMRNHLDCTTTFKALFSLNGMAHKAIYTTPDDFEKRDVSISNFVKEVARVIAIEILEEPFNRCDWR